MKKKPTIAMVAEAVDLFKQYHNGVAPTCLVAEKDALVAVASAEGKIGLKGVPVRTEVVDRKKLAKPGEGEALALFLTYLPGGQIAAGVTEYVP
jgi:hypothetical protein